jgi:hypothetical protein
MYDELLRSLQIPLTDYRFDPVYRIHGDNLKTPQWIRFHARH